MDDGQVLVEEVLVLDVLQQSLQLDVRPAIHRRILKLKEYKNSNNVQLGIAKGKLHKKTHQKKQVQYSEDQLLDLFTFSRLIS